MAKICGNCFKETTPYGSCPHCGHDNEANRQNFPLALPAGSILYGQYIVGKVLGQGGFGITYKAKDYRSGGIVAIKEFFPDTMATRTDSSTVTPFYGSRGEHFDYGKTTFLEEAQTMAEFNGNPNITGVQLYFEENGTAYFVMEYLDGCSFGDYIAQHGGRLSWVDTAKVMLPVLNVLSEIHSKGIIHRDIAPDNIYITKNGTVKVLDFGAARHSLGNVSQSLDVVVKHGFAPKEQYSRRGRQGPYTDVYAACATIYFALTGVKPDDAIDRAEEDNLPPPTVLGAKISLPLEDVILKGLSVDAKDRYQSAIELREALTGKAAGGNSDSTTSGGTTDGGSSGGNSDGNSGGNSGGSSVPRLDWSSLLKKPQSIAIGAVLLMLLCFGLFMALHTHKYGEWVTTIEPSCETTGIQQHRCFCGHTETINIKETGHRAIVDHGYAATRTTSGLTDGSHCSVCGKVLTEQTVISQTVFEMKKQPAHLYDDYQFWGTSYINSSVKTVTFRDTLSGAPATAYDISAARDKSILCWMDGSELIVAANGKIAPSSDASYLFCNFDNLERINFNNCFDTSGVTDMNEMFCGCQNLRELDLSCFDTSNVTDMSYMFTRCYITDLNISGFDTSRVTNMEGMFSNVYTTELDFSGFDTSRVTNMAKMFSNCHTTKLDLSSFDTSSVTTMAGMFQNCYVTEFDISSFDTSNVTSMYEMFSYFMEFSDIVYNTRSNFDRSVFDKTNVTALDLSHFDTSSVKTMAKMFFGCNLRSIDVSSFDTSNVSDMYAMFEWCQGLTTLDLSHFDTSKVTTMARMFLCCKNLKTLNLSGFDTSSMAFVGLMSKFPSSPMLKGSSIEQRYGSRLDNMFDGCNRLTKLICENERILDSYKNRSQ